MLLLRKAWFWWAAGLAILLAASALLTLLLREPAPLLTAETLEAAKRRWRDNGPSDYSLEVVVGGTQQGKHSIEVRRGQVLSMTTSGAEVAPHVRDYWSVEGMFEFLGEELANAQQPESAYGVTDRSQVVLRAVFDDRLGYPRRFLRHVMGRDAEIHWRIEMTPAAAPDSTRTPVGGSEPALQERSSVGAAGGILLGADLLA